MVNGVNRFFQHPAGVIVHMSMNVAGQGRKVCMVGHVHEAWNPDGHPMPQFRMPMPGEEAAVETHMTIRAVNTYYPPQFEATHIRR